MTVTRFHALFVSVALMWGALGPASAQSSPVPAAVAPPPVAVPTVQQESAVESGKIAWYGKKFAGRRTASGESFDPEALTMAHRTLPFGTRVKVTNLANKKSVTLRVNDRGPTQADRVGDVSLAAARRLGMVRYGLADAELEVVSKAPAGKKR